MTEKHVLTHDAIEAALEEHRSLQRSVCERKYQAAGEDNLAAVLDRIYAEFTKSDIFARYGEEKCGRLHTMLHGGFFMPGGSILSGYGIPLRRSSLSNCYLTPIKNDSIEAIFEAMKEIARTFSFRGGTGVDITVLRPAGEAVHNAANTSSGAVSFMPAFSEVTNTIGQCGCGKTY